MKENKKIKCKPRGGVWARFEGVFGIPWPNQYSSLFDFVVSPWHMLTGRMVVIHSRPLDMGLRSLGALICEVYDGISLASLTGTPEK